jgi:hypothetical protein
MKQEAEVFDICHRCEANLRGSLHTMHREAVRQIVAAGEPPPDGEWTGTLGGGEGPCGPSGPKRTEEST